MLVKKCVYIVINTLYTVNKSHHFSVVRLLIRNNLSLFILVSSHLSVYYV